MLTKNPKHPRRRANPENCAPRCHAVAHPLEKGRMQECKAHLPCEQHK